MHLRLIRHATLAVEMGGHHLLVDPMLDPAGSRPPVAGTPSPRPNPLVELPEPPEVVVAGVDGVLVTHLHQDHLDDTAVERLPEGVPVLCQPEDAAALRERGLAGARPVVDTVAWDDIEVTRTPGRHGTGELADRLGPVSGFVLRELDGPALYLAGDTVWCDEVRSALEEHHPDVVVVNAGGARFTEGDPITMTADDLVAVARHAPWARVVAVHVDAVNHCLEGRADLHQRVRDEGLTDRVTVPEDGAAVPVP